jgi:predicted O-methyltransferase YrrM
MKTWKQVSGFFHPDEALELQRICTNKEVLEIGAFYGKTTVCIAEVAISVTTVDTWAVDGNGQTQLPEINETVFNTFKDSIKEYGNVTYLVGRSEKIVPGIDRQFDVVFIDAEHSYNGVLSDIRVTLPKLKDNGVFVFHDYGTWAGVTQAIDEVFDISRITGPVVSLASFEKEALWIK